MSTLIKRYFFFILGLIINSFGVAFITKSALGTSQISSIPYVLSLKFTNLSFGQTTFIFNMLFILIQLLILKKDFHPIQFLQVLANILFSFFIDISMLVLAWLNPQMWAELFLENKDFLMRELNILIENLQKYELAMEQDDLPGLTALLDEGRRRKEEVDGH